MANCLGGQYGGGILRYVPRLERRVYDYTTRGRCGLMTSKSVDRPILTLESAPVELCVIQTVCTNSNIDVTRQLNLHTTDSVYEF